VKEDLIDDPNDDLTSKKPSGNEKIIRINRYLFSWPFEGDMLINEARSTRYGALFAALLFGGGFGVFFTFITVHSYQKEGYHPAMWMTIFFAAFGYFLATVAIMGAYSKKRSYLFTESHFVYTNLFGMKSTISRPKIESVFVSKTIIENNYGRQEDYSYGISFRVSRSVAKDGKYSVMQVEGRDNIVGSFVGALDYTGMTQTEAECYHICELIAEHWNIPVRV